jgi:adenylate kinase
VKCTELTRRLEKFRGINTEENTVLNYFDELEIHPVVLRLDQMALDEALGQIKKIVGRPHNYGPSPAELAEMKRIADEEAVSKSLSPAMNLSLGRKRAALI